MAKVSDPVFNVGHGSVREYDETKLPKISPRPDSFMDRASAEDDAWIALQFCC